MAADTLFQTICRNLLVLMGGAGVAMVINLATVWLNARALGADGLGVITLVQSFAAFITGFVSFGTQQSYIRLCTLAIADGRRDSLPLLTGIALGLDALAGVLGGLVALLAFPLFLSLSPELEQYSSYIQIYFLTVWVSATSAMTGIFRVYDNFSKVSLVQIFGAGLNLAISTTLFISDAPLRNYLVWFTATHMATYLFQACLAYRVLKSNGVRPTLRRGTTDAKALLSEFVRYSWTTWGTSSINIARMRLDILVLGYFGNTTVVGVYGVLRQITGPLSKAIAAISSAAFTEVSRLAATRDEAQARELLHRLALLGMFPGAAAIMVTLLFGGVFLDFAFGSAFLVGKHALIVLVMSATIMLSAATFGGFVQVFISPRRLLDLYLIAAAIFLATLFIAVPTFGVIGAALSQMAFATAIWVSSWILLRVRLRSSF